MQTNCDAKFMPPLSWPVFDVYQVPAAAVVPLPHTLVDAHNAGDEA